MACNSHQSQPGGGTSFLDDCDVVAAIEVVNGDSVIVCDFNKVKQKKNVPLDELLTDFTILKMDNENEEGLHRREASGPYSRRTVYCCFLGFSNAIEVI